MKKWSAGMLMILAGATWSDPTDIRERILDESIPAPHHVQIRPFLGPDGNLVDKNSVLLEWEAVEGVSYYRIFHSILVNYRKARPEDNTDQAIVLLETPYLDWVPWGRGDVVPGEDTVRVVVPVPKNEVRTWAVSAAIVEDDVERYSLLTEGEWLSFAVPPGPHIDPPTPIRGDYDQDGIVDYDDFFIFADHFGTKVGDPQWTPEYD